MPAPNHFTIQEPIPPQPMEVDIQEERARRLRREMIERNTHVQELVRRAQESTRGMQNPELTRDELEESRRMLEDFYQRTPEETIENNEEQPHAERSSIYSNRKFKKLKNIKNENYDEK